MAKQVSFTNQAKADLRAIPQPIAIQILRTLARFLESEEGNVKRLQGVDPPLYRLRTQDHRVIFRDLGEHIEVTRIRDRSVAPLYVTNVESRMAPIGYLAALSF